MANTCENNLEIRGTKEEVSHFMANVFEVEHGGIEYKFSGSDEILPFGWLQNRSEYSIVFDSKWEAPIDNILEMSKLHPMLTFSLIYVIPNDEVAGIVEIKNAEFIRDEEDDIDSDLAREILGDDYVDDLINQDVCKNILKMEGNKEQITNFMSNIYEENKEISYNPLQNDEDDAFYFGRLQNRDENMIAFDCEYEPPIDTVLEISELHPDITFTLSYAIPSEEIAGIYEIEGGEVINEEEDDIYSDLAREMFGDEYVDNL